MRTISENAKLIAEKRYLKIDKDGTPKENIDEMFQRIAKYIAKAEKIDKSSKSMQTKVEEDFYYILKDRKFTSGMVMLDRGRENILAACYVLPLKDSIESIYTTLLNSVQLHRRGAGIGYDFSAIRPEGNFVKTTGKKASGPVSFMRLYDFSSEEIMNKGAVRHAGHMGILRIDHPDIMRFIKAKTDMNELNNFNISIAVTDEFYDSYKNNKTFELKWPVSDEFEYNSDKRALKVYEELNPREMIDDIAKRIHKSAEPGFIFIDKVNKFNPTPNVGLMTATNQCGEQPLLPYEACNLGNIDLSKYFTNGEFDWDDLKFTVETAVRFLDNTITMTNHLLPEINNIVAKGNRKIGLGVMGLADLFYLMDIPYESKKARETAEEIMKFIWENAADASSKLGKEKGSFGNFKDSKWDESSNVEQAKQNPRRYKTMRNATVTTIAPTGTTALFADCNGGIEPFYALSYKRMNMETMGENTEMIYTNDILTKRLKSDWLYNKELDAEIFEKGSLRGIDSLPEKIRKVFVTAKDIDAKDHVLMQSVFQKWTDNAVSKTINMPSNATVEQIIEIFELAYETDCKGLTIYRDKSRDKQVLN
ncbi:adenosylcobalamin-dependent ribonucleoside-diphosphate reductase [Candidatus Dojkabacteria bacterium]|uniref:Vitamin B12-dependent ribonucleotide reductase n=1 Tax=Candidatus Dojkabacteria bacterium TaxID=2099670 RepID=A0A955L309_9BACT|nr:adenosylcobalamin-dependent ribonucleoside-diphosphate reductase [Candidatus Dojkabacteria bacterium]